MKSNSRSRSWNIKLASTARTARKLLTRYTHTLDLFQSLIQYNYSITYLGLLSLCHLLLQVSRMLEEHDWIHSERQFFGKPNTSYDFKTNNPREAGQRLKKLEETTTKLERNVNKRAMNMLNEAEERVRTERVSEIEF